MRNLMLLLAALAIGSSFGCGKKEEEAGTLKSTAPINNDAPEAKNAPVAPRDPSIIMPGGAGSKGKKM